MDVRFPSGIIKHMRKNKFVTGEFYHVYNRGTDKRRVFIDEYDYGRFLQSMEEFNSLKPIGSIYENSFVKINMERQFGNRTSKFKQPLVKIVCYHLNANHFHLILRQEAKNGISEYLKRVAGGYTKYFNSRWRRNGVLFQGKFKANHISSNEYLLHLSAYVNLNDRLHTKTSQLEKNKNRSSWHQYTEILTNPIIPCSTNIILDQFKNQKKYELFALESLKSIKERKKQDKELVDILID